MGNIINGDIQQNSDELVRGKQLSFLGFNSAQIADYYNSNISAFSDQGWDDVGLVDQISPDKQYEVLELASGAPSTSKGGIVIGLSMSIGLSYSHPTLTGLDMSNASNYAMLLNASSDAAVQVTSGSTKRKLVFTSSSDTTNFKRNDLLIVDLSHGTSYGLGKSICFVEKVVGAEVFVSQLSQAPVSGADVQKVAGYGSASSFGDSATPENSGITMIEGATEFPTVKSRIKTVNLTTRSIFVTLIEEAEVRNPVALNRGKGKELMTAGFTLKAIPQYGDFVDRYGNTLTKTPYLCKTTLLPSES